MKTFFLFESGFTFSWICDPRKVSAAESSCFSELSVRNSFSKKIDNQLNFLLLCCVVFFFFWWLPSYLDFAQVQSHFVGKNFFCRFCCCCRFLPFFRSLPEALFSDVSLLFSSPCVSAACELGDRLIPRQSLEA